MELRSNKSQLFKVTAETSYRDVMDASADKQPLSLAILRAELQASRETVLNEIKSEIANIRQDIKQDISALREETKAEVASIRSEIANDFTSLSTKHTELATEQSEMGRSLSDTMDRVATLEETVASVTKENKTLQEKCLDLECRSRRQNLKMFGIPEHAEAGDPVGFAATFFPAVLGAENFQTPIVVDRCHRLGAKSNERNSRPRIMIVRLHYYTEKEKILELSKKRGELLFNGRHPVFIHPDVPLQITQLRQTYGPIKAKLREAKRRLPGLDYSLYHPARFTVTFNGIRYSLNSPEAAEEFYQKKIAAAATTAAASDVEPDPNS